MFGFGIVLSIEHSSTVRQHLDRLALATVLAAKDSDERKYAGQRQYVAARTLALATAVGPELKGLGSAVVSTAVKAVCYRQSDGGVLNSAVAQQQQQCVIDAHMSHTFSSTSRKHLGEL